MMNYKSMVRYFFLLLAFFLIPGSEHVRTEAQVKTGQRGTSQNHQYAANLTLVNQDNQPFQLAQLRGKVVLLFFGYTSCPDACPTTLSKLSGLYKMLGPAGDRVVTLFVSLDPDRDTPGVLKQYLKYFKVNSVGVTGTKKEIDTLVSKYGARYEIEKSDSAAGYHINHSTDLYLLNQKGAAVRRFKYADDSQLIADAVRRLIR
jgi:cytochrome oxidase Cu insertion factor (SCO1/SenC/PrrC family)